MPCLSSIVHTLWQLLQYPVITCPLFVLICPKSEQAFRLGLSDIRLLRCNYPLFIITQKDILFINRMNLYFHGLFVRSVFEQIDMRVLVKEVCLQKG